MFWLDEQRGHLTDWITQRWVQYTGQPLHASQTWLTTPSGPTNGIGSQFFAELAEQSGWTLEQGSGLMQFDALDGSEFNAKGVQVGVKHFYEQTSTYHLDVWFEWFGIFKLFGALVVGLFSRRLQQLNLPLSALETSRGISSQVLELRDPDSKQVMLRAWLRQLLSNNQVLYAGMYATSQIPNSPQACVRVAFPLPNGSAVVILKPSLEPDGSLLLHSNGHCFGDPGFYFTLHNAQGSWVKYVPTFHETIHVYEAEPGCLRTDHMFQIWGLKFLHLHYRMTEKKV